MAIHTIFSTAFCDKCRGELMNSQNRWNVYVYVIHNTYSKYSRNAIWIAIVVERCHYSRRYWGFIGGVAPNTQGLQGLWLRWQAQLFSGISWSFPCFGGTLFRIKDPAGQSLAQIVLNSNLRCLLGWMPMNKAPQAWRIPHIVWRKSHWSSKFVTVKAC